MGPTCGSPMIRQQLPMEERTGSQPASEALRGVVVLYTEGCPATPKTCELIAECLSELGLDVELRKVLIASQEEAERRRFLGSPTVQINGIDIDPAARDSEGFGLT